LLLIFGALALKSAPKCNPLSLRCRCPSSNHPICGESGRTHANPCIANCFGDKVKHEGPCTNQCQSSKQQCKYEKFGVGGGKRLKCCDKVEVCFGKTCTESTKNCKWKGGVIKRKKNGTLFLEKKKVQTNFKEYVANGKKFVKVLVKEEQECVTLLLKDVNGLEELLQQNLIENAIMLTH